MLTPGPKRRSFWKDVFSTEFNGEHHILAALGIGAGLTIAGIRRDGLFSLDWVLGAVPVVTGVFLVFVALRALTVRRAWDKQKAD